MNNKKSRRQADAEMRHKLERLLLTGFLSLLSKIGFQAD